MNLFSAQGKRIRTDATWFIIVIVVDIGMLQNLTINTKTFVHFSGLLRTQTEDGLLLTLLLPR